MKYFLVNVIVDGKDESYIGMTDYESITEIREALRRHIKAWCAFKDIDNPTWKDLRGAVTMSVHLPEDFTQKPIEFIDEVTISVPTMSIFFIGRYLADSPLYPH